MDLQGKHKLYSLLKIYKSLKRHFKQIRNLPTHPFQSDRHMKDKRQATKLL